MEIVLSLILSTVATQNPEEHLRVCSLQGHFFRPHCTWRHLSGQPVFGNDTGKWMLVVAPTGNHRIRIVRIGWDVWRSACPNAKKCPQGHLHWKTAVWNSLCGHNLLLTFSLGGINVLEPTFMGNYWQTPCSACPSPTVCYHFAQGNPCSLKSMSVFSWSRI